MVKLFRNKNLLSNIKMANIDESLYSRQIAEIGLQAICSLTESKVIQLPPRFEGPRAG